MQTPRTIRRVKRHSELLRIMLVYPNESRAAMEALGVDGQLLLSQKQERKLFHEIKGRVNGSDYS